MGLRRLIFMVSVFGLSMPMVAQTGAGAIATRPPVPVDPAAGAKLPSETVRPALEVLKQALDGLTVDKWKASGVIKTEAETNVGSMKRDIDSTLPGLLATADAAPGSAARMLPAYRNVDALYDVLLRVTIAGRLAGPSQQSSALDQALARLDEGRRALGDGLQDRADAQEKRVSDLQAALKTAQTAAPAPVQATAPVCPAPPVKKKVKPAVKPTTPAPN